VIADFYWQNKYKLEAPGSALNEIIPSTEDMEQGEIPIVEIVSSKFSGDKSTA
jgi:hypothetical protein